MKFIKRLLCDHDNWKVVVDKADYEAYRVLECKCGKQVTINDHWR